MALRAFPELYANAFEGVNTAVSPEMIAPTQLQWGKNIVNRGAKPTTRPPFIYRMSLPSGLVQGASYFGVQGGMGVASIAGNMWRLRIGPANYSAEQITLPWRNSAVIPKVYMQQTVETLVIQDGQSNPILYDGSTAERSVPSAGGVPRGTVMAYGNGRLWVAINSKELVAGDIRTNQAGSELQFTETNYLSGGGTLYFPRGITALGFIATTGTSDYGALLVFGLDYTESVRADITFRDLWAQTPGFVTNVLRHTGCASHWSLAEVNQDLYWRDAGGGLRSIRSALADESGPGNAPISREISRLTDYDSRQLLGYSSAISFNNRLIVTSSPYLNESHGVSWKDLAPLDFAPMSTMRGKSFPSYDGEWDGLNFTHLFQGQFNGRSRAFGVASNPDGTNALWEIMEDGRGGLDDVTVICTDGSSTATPYPITCMLESGARSAGDAKVRKRAERCDVFVSDMLGPVNLKVYWRVDNNQKWLLWDEGLDVCAKNGDPEVEGATTHVWKNIRSQQRPQIKTYTVPTAIDPITAFALQTGFEFQIRLVWTGRLKIDKFILWLHRLDESPYAAREIVVASCLTNDVTGNEIIYEIPFQPCPPVPVEDNAPYGWGANTLGEQGSVDPADKLSPTEVIFALVPLQFAAGSFFSILLADNGTLWSTGFNIHGSLGLGDLVDRDIFTQIGAATDWASIAAGANGYHTGGIKEDGALWLWGENGFGQVGNGNTTDQTSPVLIGADTWAKLAIGADHSLGIKTDGTLWAWGRGANGRLGLGGTSNFNTPQQVGVDADWSEVAGGDNHTLAVKTDGTLWACGRNDAGQLGNGTLVQELSLIQIGADTNWSLVYAMDDASMAIKSNGTLWSWGKNGNGQLGLGDESLRVDPEQVGVATNWLKGSGGERHSLMIKTNGTLWATGYNGAGELGLGDTTQRNVFTQVGSEASWTDIAAGESHSMGIHAP